MVDQPHARFYGSLPPVVRPRRWRWLTAGAVFVAAVAAVGIAQALHSHPAATSISARPVHGALVFDRYWLIWIGVSFIVFIAGGALGFACVRGWWSMVAVDAVGLALLVALFAGAFTVSYMLVDTWFCWVFGVSAGNGVRGLIRRGQIRAATRPAGIALLVGIVASVVGIASYEERRPRWPGYQGGNERFYFWVTPWWAYVGAVILGLLGVALAVLIFRGKPRGHERDLPV